MVFYQLPPPPPPEPSPDDPPPPSELDALENAEEKDEFIDESESANDVVKTLFRDLNFQRNANKRNSQREITITATIARTTCTLLVSKSIILPKYDVVLSTPIFPPSNNRMFPLFSAGMLPKMMATALEISAISGESAIVATSPSLS